MIRSAEPRADRVMFRADPAIDSKTTRLAC